MRTTPMFALAAATALTLSACGGGSDPLTQEQTAEALLTEEEFPLEGFTAGTIQEGTGDTTADPDDDPLAGFPGADQLEQECQDALSEIGSMDAVFDAQSSLEFTGTAGAEDVTGPPTVQLVVAALGDGDNPLDLIDGLNSSCEEVTVEDGGMSMTMTFSEVDGDAQGTTIGIEMAGLDLEVIFAGREDGGTYTVVTGMGITDDEAIQVLDAQDEKIASL